MKKEYLIAIVVLVLIGVVAFVMMGRNQVSESPNLAVNSNQQSLPGEDGVKGNTVVYTDSGYSPAELTVEVGTTVIFVNQSNLPMWTASDPHPLHTDYAEFDHRRAVNEGETYEFTFTEAGSYPYHNHMSPQHTGTLVVE